MMGISEILETLKQVLIISDTQRRQEEDIKEMKKFMIEVSITLQRISDRIDITDARTRGEIEHLAKQTKLEIENLALRMQLAAKDQPTKIQPAQITSGDEPKSQRGRRKT